MYRIAIFVFYLCVVTRSEETGFTTEPSSVVVRQGDRVRLRCKTNIPSEEITWYFNDVMVTSPTDPTDSRRQRRKRNKEDRVSSEVHSGPHLDFRDSTPISRSSLPRRNNILHFSNPKRGRRRKKDYPKKEKRRSHKPEEHLSSLKTTKRYVRSVPEQPGNDDILTYGIQIRPGRLTILNFAERNVGNYYCVASGENGAIRSRSAFVQLAEISEFNFAPPRSVMAYVGDAAVIPCQLPVSVPVADARWKINDITWLEGSTDSYAILPSGSLVVTNTSGSSGSKFRCGARNSITDQTKWAAVATVLTIKDRDTARIDDVIHYSGDDIINVTSRSGNRTLLECVTSHRAKAAWSRGNLSLPDGASITTDGLLLPATSPSDTGTYSCQVPGSATTIIYRYTVLDAPTVTALPTAENGNSLSCASANSRNASLDWTWYRNAVLLEDAKSNVLNLSAMGESTTNGFYQCFAENSQGSDYAILVVNVYKSADSSPTITTSDEYFNLPESVIPTPDITSTVRSNEPNSYELSWTLGEGSNAKQAKLFSIKYYKTPSFTQDGTLVSYAWKVANVLGDRRSVVLSDLQPDSTYVLEMVAVDDAGGRSSIQISSFSTAEVEIPQITNSVPAKPPLVGKDKKKKNKGSGKQKRKDRSKVPMPPSRPTVTSISGSSVSLMWNPRGNGGYPIKGYRIQRRKVNTKEEWETAVRFVTHPPHELTDLQRGAIYKFRVVAVNAAGDSPPSSATPSYPRRVSVDIQPLHESPYIEEVTTQGDTDIVVTWEYPRVPESNLGGYYVFYRPSDSDDERDYVEERVNDPTATSYVIHYLEPEMQYDVKIQAYNSMGRSPYSNVMIIEMPKPRTGSVDPTDKGRPADPNLHVRENAYQRNTMFLITGAVIGLVLLVLLVTVFCYWRRKGNQNAESSPELKQRNGNAPGLGGGNHMNMKKLNSNGNHLGHDSNSPTPNQYSQSPHDTQCQCSRHHSNHSSLERGGGSEYHQYMMAPYSGERVEGGFPDGAERAKRNWVPANYPNIHQNPMHVYMDHRHPYFPHGYGRGVAVPGGPPLWWLREAGEFCHIVPGGSRKMSGGELSPEVTGPYPASAMVRTFAGNVTTGYYGDPGHRPPDNGYHSNEEGLRSSSDSQVGKLEEAPPRDSDSDAGVVTSDRGTEASQSTSSSPDALKENGASSLTSEATTVIYNEPQGGRGDIDDVTEETPLNMPTGDDTPRKVDENTNFIENSPDVRKETLIT